MHQKLHPRNRWKLIFLAPVVASLLSSCGGGGNSETAPPPDPLKKYREQTVQWSECDSSILGSRSDEYDDLWELSGDRLRCSSVRAPLDWSNPQRGDVIISVMRLTTASPEKRRGTLLFNPGGPGTDGLKLTFRLLNAFSTSNPDSPQGALQLSLLAEYDAVGFSPRGVGASTRLQCETNELERPVDTSLAGWDATGNIANVIYNSRKKAEACSKNPITPYINTDATARDMDLVRSLLGEKKLNYIGYSYGTWLGAWYANLFPENVGRMVLDSSADFTSTLQQSVIGGQAPARQYLHDNILAPYAARHAGRFQLGSTTDAVRAVFFGLDPKIQQLLGMSLSGLGYYRNNADEYLGTISAAQNLDQLLKASTNPDDDEVVGKALEDHVFDASNPGRDALLRNAAVTLYAAYLQTWVNPAPKHISASALDAVHCNDSPPIATDPIAWAGWVRSRVSRAPIFAPGDVDRFTCAYWGGPAVTKPDLQAMKSLDILFVQSQYDAATYTEGANNFFAQLPTARRVYVTGDYQHGVYPYSDSCVDPIVTRYLLGQSPTQRETICQGHPLEQDKVPAIASQGASLKQSRAASDQGLRSTYKNPEKANELINEFKRGLIPPNLRP